VISSFARAARLEINPLFVSPLAKGEIQCGFWASRLRRYDEAEPAVYFMNLSAEETSRLLKKVRTASRSSA
jgi:hypothetical protein